jgi:acyl-CoA thioesterase I
MEAITMKVVCIGDSFTHGFKIRSSEAWPSLLADKWGIEVLNKGINGDSTAGMLSRFHRDVIQAEATHVIISGGVNDLILRVPADVACSNIATMVHHARCHRITPVIGIEVPVEPEMAETFWPDITDFHQVNRELAELRQKLLSFAKGFRVGVADFYGELELPGVSDYRKELYSDGLHLKAEGNRLVLDAVKLG